MTKALQRITGAVIGIGLSIVLAVATAGAAGASATPTAVTGPSSALSVTGATVSGNVDPNGEATTWWFEYGTSASYGLSTASASAGAGATSEGVSTHLSGLTPGTTYHYRLVAKDSAGDAYGADATFRTPALPPHVTKTSIVGIHDTSAVVDAEINPNGLATTWDVHYGISPSLSATSAQVSSGAGDAPVTTALKLSGLAPHTSYVVEVVAVNAAGTTRATEVSFSTDGPPVVASEAAVPLSTTTVKLSASVLPDGHATTWYFEYGPTTNYGARTASGSTAATSSPVTVSTTVTKLVPNATYQFRLLAANAAGTVVGANESFTMPGPSLFATPSTITFGASVTLSGAVPNGAANEPVAIYADVTPSPSFAAIATVLTGAKGTWAYNVQPRIGTSYKVLWKTEVSPIISVGVSPAVSIRFKGSSRFVTHVSGATSFNGRVVRLQRFESGRWRTIGARRLNRASSATFRPRLSTGTVRLRVYLTAYQAGPGYGAGFSSAHRYRV